MEEIDARARNESRSRSLKSDTHFSRNGQSLIYAVQRAIQEKKQENIKDFNVGSSMGMEAMMRPWCCGLDRSTARSSKRKLFDG